MTLRDRFACRKRREMQQIQRFIFYGFLWVATAYFTGHVIAVVLRQ